MFRVISEDCTVYYESNNYAACKKYLEDNPDLTNVFIEEF